MANNKVKIKGVNGRSTRPMSYDHVTTIDFNVVKPFGIWECVPGDRINVRPEVWMRLQAMNCPTFGKMDVITRAFFVPHRLVFRNFLDFWSQNPVRTTGQSTTTLVRTCKQMNMRTFTNYFVKRFTETDATTFARPYLDVDAWTGSDASAFSLTFGAWVQNDRIRNDREDFCMHYGANHIHYRMNPIGKRVWDILYSLGYRFQMFTNTSNEDYNTGGDDNEYMVSMMPILSYLKIFSDYYCPSQYKYIFNVDHMAEDMQFSMPDDINSLFDMLTYSCFLWYNDDMFSLCESAPYNKQNYTSGGIFGMTYQQSSLDANSIIDWSAANTQLAHGDPKLGAYSPTNAPNSWTVRAVQRVANLLQKNNLLSPRAQDYLKAKFGVTPSAARLDVAEYLGHASAPVKISDVVSTSMSNNADEGNSLGQLGGKGTSYQINNLQYSAEEFGYFILTIELRTRIDYGQGVNPLVLRVRHEDFWQEETDALGFTPVPTECLVSGPVDGSYRTNDTYLGVIFNRGAQDDRVFGYLPKYWSYKINHGNLSGDFGIPKNQDIQAYHLMRTIEGRDLPDYVGNSLKFRYPGLCYYDNQFSRIFVSGDAYNVKDHFQLIGSFECFINGYPLALNESWQVNPDGEERQGAEQHIQSVL